MNTIEPVGESHGDVPEYAGGMTPLHLGCTWSLIPILFNNCIVKLYSCVRLHYNEINGTVYCTNIDKLESCPTTPTVYKHVSMLLLITSMYPDNVS